MLCYTGKPRQSGINNWEVMKAHIDAEVSARREFVFADDGRSMGLVVEGV